MARRTHAAESPAPAKARWGLGLVVAAVAIALTAGVVATGVATRPHAETPAYEQYIPSDAALAARLAPSAEHWTLAGALVGDFQLDTKWAAISKGVTSLGLSYTPGATPQQGRAVYLQADTAARAKAVEKRLQADAGAGMRSVGRHGATLIITDMTDAGLSAVKAFEKGTESRPQALRDDLAAADADSAIWIDFDQFASYASAGAEKERAKAATAYWKHVLGLRSETRWVGKPSTNGDAWTGSFRSGGLDESALDPGSAISAAKNSVSKKIDTSLFVTGTTAKYHTDRSAINDITLGTVGDLGKWTRGMTTTAPVTAQIGLSSWLAATSGQTEVGEGISTLNLAITGGSLDVGFVSNSIGDDGVIEPTKAPEAPESAATATAAPQPPTAVWVPGDHNPVTDGAREDESAGEGSAPVPVVPKPTATATPTAPSSVGGREPTDVGTGDAYENPIPDGFGSGG